MSTELSPASDAASRGGYAAGTLALAAPALLVAGFFADEAFLLLLSLPCAVASVVLAVRACIRGAWLTAGVALPLLAWVGGILLMPSG
jgi:hypothetical protein